MDSELERQLRTVYTESTWTCAIFILILACLCKGLYVNAIACFVVFCVSGMVLYADYQVLKWLKLGKVDAKNRGQKIF